MRESKVVSLTECLRVCVFIESLWPDTDRTYVDSEIRARL